MPQPSIFAVSDASQQLAGSRDSTNKCNIGTGTGGNQSHEDHEDVKSFRHTHKYEFEIGSGSKQIADQGCPRQSLRS